MATIFLYKVTWISELQFIAQLISEEWKILYTNFLKTSISRCKIFNYLDSSSENDMQSYF